MIVISVTYEIVTPESAEYGEIADSGFIKENEQFEFRELINLMWREGYRYPSDSMGTPRWMNTDGDTDYETGDVEYRSIHPGRDQMSQKYWAKACKYIFDKDRGIR